MCEAGIDVSPGAPIADNAAQFLAYQELSVQ